jgi:hypothetical protein
MWQLMLLAMMKAKTSVDGLQREMRAGGLRALQHSCK